MSAREMQLEGLRDGCNLVHYSIKIRQLLATILISLQSTNEISCTLSSKGNLLFILFC